MMNFSKLNWLALACLGASALPASTAPAVKERAPVPWSNYNNNGVFYPMQSATSWRTLYARSLQLPDLSLLLTWEDYDPTVALTYWPIYRSTDGGVSFSPLSRVQDTANGWGNWYNPHLYALPQSVGGFPAGTILIAGESTPRSLSQAYIDLYASTDGGVTWQFVSHIVYAPGPEIASNGDKAVWEPFLMMYNNQLVCYYSTQVDPNHAQKLSHKTTTDLRNWSQEVDDVAFSTYSERPGMTTVAYSPKSGKYVMTFEYCGAPTGGCPVYYKVATNPLQFAAVTPLPLLTSSNPSSSPYIIWTALPGSSDGSGIFIANGNTREEIFVNTDAVDPNGWRAINVGQWSAYSRSLRVIDTPASSVAKGAKKLFIANGGNMGCTGSCSNFVADGLVDIPKYPG